MHPDLGDIVRDIQALGYEEKEMRTSGIDALTSPITYLYEQFNRMERSKREVARLENEDCRRELLKELMVKYVDYDIVSLDPQEFDAFVEFVDPGEAVLKALTQYEFILWTRERFTAFKARAGAVAGRRLRIPVGRSIPGLLEIGGVQVKGKRLEDQPCPRNGDPGDASGPPAVTVLVVAHHHVDEQGNGSDRFKQRDPTAAQVDELHNPRRQVVRLSLLEDDVRQKEGIVRHQQHEASVQQALFGGGSGGVGHGAKLAGRFMP